MSFAVGIGSHAEGGLTARPQDSLTSQAARAQYWSSLDARHGLRENTFRKSLITRRGAIATEHQVRVGQQRAVPGVPAEVVGGPGGVASNCHRHPPPREPLAMLKYG